MEVFQKEKKILELAQKALSSPMGMNKHEQKTFKKLVKAYGKLLRQSHRMVTMGDRIQQSLNDLNVEIAASEVKYRGVFENVNEGIYRSTPDGTILEINPAMATMFGFMDSIDFLDSIKNIENLFCSSSEYDHYTFLINSKGARRREFQVCCPDGTKLWVEVSACTLFDKEGTTCTGIVGVLSDVTERRKMQTEMCRLARTDSLTSLWNRGYFMELANREVVRWARSESPLSLLMVDIDFFKKVNDTFGHDVGDKVLIALSSILTKSVREVDIVGRLGGEEFVVLLPNATQNDALCVAKRMVETVRNSVIKCRDGKVPLTISIGLTSFISGDDLESVLKFSDMALYAAKENGRDRIEVSQHNSETFDTTDFPILQGKQRGENESLK